MLDEQKYPFALRFRVEKDGTMVFPVQSDIENLAIATNQDNGKVYSKIGIHFGENKLVFSEDYMGWVLE